MEVETLRETGREAQAMLVVHVRLEGGAEITLRLPASASWAVNVLKGGERCGS